MKALIKTVIFSVILFLGSINLSFAMVSLPYMKTSAKVKAEDILNKFRNLGCLKDQGGDYMKETAKNACRDLLKQSLGEINAKLHQYKQYTHFRANNQGLTDSALKKEFLAQKETFLRFNQTDLLLKDVDRKLYKEFTRENNQKIRNLTAIIELLNTRIQIKKRIAEVDKINTRKGALAALAKTLLNPRCYHTGNFLSTVGKIVKVITYPVVAPAKYVSKSYRQYGQRIDFAYAPKEAWDSL